MGSFLLLVPAGKNTCSFTLVLRFSGNHGLISADAARCGLLLSTLIKLSKGALLADEVGFGKTIDEKYQRDNN